ncbi:hypothetical protein [Flavobacterium sp. LM4]|uniref:hypothetical protein n=1 Tax=Flavobacterium sp. LM4 TaxID=1938609 RepID=UPI000992F0FB|nr:hypothetical protein [Flavobacterium sp. LM4]OOV20108.1 hypothetical protein BXU10_10945 [Flavobacterium sp. LM4]
MKSFILIITFFFINFGNQETDKLIGSYYFICENGYFTNQNDKIIFKDSTYAFSNKFIPSGKISYGNSILLDNFTNSKTIISIPKNQIEKDTMIFYIHDRNGFVMNYLDIAVGKGKFIKIK